MVETSNEGLFSPGRELLLAADAFLSEVAKRSKAKYKTASALEDALVAARYLEDLPDLTDPRDDRRRYCIALTQEISEEASDIAKKAREWVESAEPESRASVIREASQFVKLEMGLLQVRARMAEQLAKRLGVDKVSVGEDRAKGSIDFVERQARKRSQRAAGDAS